MNRTLFSLTFRNLLSRRRALFMALLALLPVGIALLYRLTVDLDDPQNDPRVQAPEIVSAIVATLILPLVSLVLGTAALGAEIEDGTAVYLLAKPIERWRIIAVKVIVAAGGTLLLVGPPAAIAALIALGGSDPDGVAISFAVAVAIGATAYCSIFIGLSAMTSRALIIGLAYVFVWETFVTNIFSGTRWLSVREYVIGIADMLSSAPPDGFNSRLDGPLALVAAAIVTAVAITIAVRRLEHFEIGERV